MLRTRALLLQGSLILLGACVHFMPQQKPEIVKQLNIVNDQLSKAKATLVVDKAAPFSKIEPLMIGALAAADQATAIAEARAVDSHNSLSGKPADNARKILRNCRDSIKSDAIAMKDNGVPANETDNLDAIMGGSCSVASFLETIMRK